MQSTPGGLEVFRSGVVQSTKDCSPHPTPEIHRGRTDGLVAQRYRPSSPRQCDDSEAVSSYPSIPLFSLDEAPDITGSHGQPMSIR